MAIPHLLFTIGDPSGIGPEVCLKSLFGWDFSRTPFQATVIGSDIVFNHPQILPLYKSLYQLDNISFLNTGSLRKSFSMGSVSAESGKASAQYLLAALQQLDSNRADALITAPISKEGLQLANIPHTGHTTFLSHHYNHPPVSMGFVSDSLNIILHTIHIPYSNVPETLEVDALRTTISNAFQLANYLKIKSPRIAISGLNPHCGENGLFGTEERNLLIPALSILSDEGLSILGPFAPDTLFKRAVDGEFDIVIALYHDQGLIPLKLLAFDTAVNVTLGLPIIRTSPDHGTAFDIAYQNCANPSSMTAAITQALSMIPPYETTK